MSRRLERLEVVADEVRRLGCSSVRVSGVDFEDRAKRESFLQNEAENLNRVDVLLNNAGFALGVAKVQDLNPDDLRAMFEVNVLAAQELTRACLPGMLRRNSGHLVFVGSVAGRWAYSGGAAYGASKAAVDLFCEALRLDLFGTRVRVTQVLPGLVDTEFSLRRLGDKALANEVYRDMTPLSGDDVAECIEWSLSRPEHINVQELVVFPTDQAGVGHVARPGRK
jgi:hypothetical protein